MRITGFNARGSYGVGLGLMALLAATGALSLGASGNVPRLKAQPPVDGSARTSDGVFFARSSLPTSTIGTSGEQGHAAFDESRGSSGDGSAGAVRDGRRPWRWTRDRECVGRGRLLQDRHGSLLGSGRQLSGREHADIVSVLAVTVIPRERKFRGP